MSRSLGGVWVMSRSPMKILPVVDLLQPREHPQGRGLAAPGRADEDHELAVADLQVDARHRGLVRPRIPALCLLKSHCGHADVLPSPAGTCRTIRSEVTSVTLGGAAMFAEGRSRPWACWLTSAGPTVGAFPQHVTCVTETLCTVLDRPSRKRLHARTERAGGRGEATEHLLTMTRGKGMRTRNTRRVAALAAAVLGAGLALASCADDDSRAAAPAAPGPEPTRPSARTCPSWPTSAT